MKVTRYCLLLLCTLLCLIALSTQAETMLEIPGDIPVSSREDAIQLAESAAEAYYADEELRSLMAEEITEDWEVVPSFQYETIERDVYTLSHEGLSMKFFMEIIGEPDENGKYPLYITLHGGGGGPEEGNNDQWIAMFAYYRKSVENGIYIACRGVTDTWDLHFQPESYPLYDRLIDTMILCYNADPNRVYLLGFSAGGDGVYQIAPRMADKFAAVNMSSGHPNNVSLMNLANCPICLQAGIRDYYSESAQRSIRAAEFESILNSYRTQYGFGYDHEINIHVPAGHNYDDYGNSRCLVLEDPEAFAERAVPEDMLDGFLDVFHRYVPGGDVSSLSYYSTDLSPDFDKEITALVRDEYGLETVVADANAVRFVNQFVRDPSPDNLVWDLGTRAELRENNFFYWLEADPEVNQGTIVAAFDVETNTFMIDVDDDVNGDFTIWIDPHLVDVTQPIPFIVNGREVIVQVTPSEMSLWESTLKHGDPSFAYVAKVLYSQLCAAD